MMRYTFTNILTALERLEIIAVSTATRPVEKFASSPCRVEIPEVSPSFMTGNKEPSRNPIGAGTDLLRKGTGTTGRRQLSGITLILMERIATAGWGWLYYRILCCPICL